MTFGEVKILLWVILFVGTLAYEFCTVIMTIQIIQLRSLAVANISVLVNVIGMGSVVAYTGELNNGIPILTAVWVGNFVAVEYEKKKRAKQNDNTSSIIPDSL